MATDSGKVWLAHISGDRRQNVEEHLEAVAALSSRFASAFGSPDQGYLVGLAHDIGKCSEEFQRRLCGGPIVDHSSAGAFECAKRNALWAACCVVGHHGGIPNLGNADFDTVETRSVYGRIKKALTNGIPDYECPVVLPSISAPHGYGDNYIDDYFVIKMLFSCLVDADFLDTEHFMSGNAAEEHSYDSLADLLCKLKQFVSDRGWLSPKGELNQARSDVLNSCLNESVQSQSLYTLTVPTGGGKTIASLGFALSHVVKTGKARVIYVLPYTSIIEQTADVFRTILGKENVVEHHSDIAYTTGDYYEGNGYVRATENWDAPVIVTTSVQFFESLYDNRPSKCRKLHNIANSVVVFDEAQFIPVSQLRPCVAAITKVAELFNTTVVLCAATQPVLGDLVASYCPGLKSKELCPNSTLLYSALRRATVVDVGALEQDELLAALKTHEQVLCIVNTYVNGK